MLCCRSPGLLRADDGGRACASCATDRDFIEINPDLLICVIVMKQQQGVIDGCVKGLGA